MCSGGGAHLRTLVPSLSFQQVEELVCEPEEFLQHGAFRIKASISMGVFNIGAEANGNNLCLNIVPVAHNVAQLLPNCCPTVAAGPYDFCHDYDEARHGVVPLLLDA